MGICGYVIIGVGLHVTSRELALFTPPRPCSVGTTVVVDDDGVVVVVADGDVVTALLTLSDDAEYPTVFGDGGTGSVCI